MFLCLRIDLDYVPWDTPDAEAFGHGEPATLLRLLDLARAGGYRFHFFASNRVLRAFPTSAETVLNEGHDLDWLCKHPTDHRRRLEEAMRLFAEIGHKPVGLALRDPWPAPGDGPIDLAGFQFISSPPSEVPAGIRHFPVDTRGPREAVRAGQTARAWTDSAKASVREHASRGVPVTVAVRPQVLAKYDPRLGHIKEILDIAPAVDMPIKTLRQALAEG